MRKQILSYLEKNSKMDSKEIAILLGTEPDVVENEIRKMEEEKIICGYHTMIDWDKTSSEMVTALIEVRVTPQRGQGFDSIAERIYKYPEVRSVYLISGGYDLMVILEGKTLKEVSQFVTDKLSTLDSVLSTATHFILKKYKETGIIDPNELQPYRMEGVGKNMIPSATDFSVIDRFVKVNDFESAHVARMLPLIEGLMCGYSSGAALAAVIKELEHLPADAVPVVLLPDHGERYMTKVFDDRWMQAQEWLNGFTPVVKDFLLELKNTYGVSPTLL